jgi:hypothetical protein
MYTIGIKFQLQSSKAAVPQSHYPFSSSTYESTYVSQTLIVIFLYTGDCHLVQNTIKATSI